MLLDIKKLGVGWLSFWENMEGWEEVDFQYEKLRYGGPVGIPALSPKGGRRQWKKHYKILIGFSGKNEMEKLG